MAEEDLPVYRYLEEIYEDEEASEAVEGTERMSLHYDLTITHDDVLLYLERHPYLQLLNLDPTFDDFEEVKLIKTSAGWSIQDFGDALSASQGDRLYDSFSPITLFAEGSPEEGEGDLGGSDLIPGSGTVIKQAFDTAISMVEMIKDRWTGVHIVGGSELMKWAAWVEASELGMDVYGFEADKDAEARRSRIKRYEMQRATTKKPGQARGD